eukprot:CAMPEP_0185761158 /NCGR_PEP_ID=MMETSP1174-20130828/20070_1 /TAXON_ID=35687 /ORGANISM="Dictyocha speculum, Strain CCMP1381" /LENGTH=361 /DNA_ID=CAMNT_0028442269 /DNA_START=15 /DNA_END=1100 /DNA_ORIENTATION=-
MEQLHPDDLGKFTCVMLKSELKARGLATSGIKSVLVARLSSHLILMERESQIGKKLGQTDDYRFRLESRHVDDYFVTNEAPPRDTVRGFHVALPTMRLGEVADFRMAPKFAFGSNGVPPHIPGNATVQFTVRLVSCTHYASGEPLEEEKRAWEQRARDDPEMTQGSIRRRSSANRRKERQGGSRHSNDESFAAAPSTRAMTPTIVDAGTELRRGPPPSSMTDRRMKRDKRMLKDEPDLKENPNVKIAGKESPDGHGCGEVTWKETKDKIDVFVTFGTFHARDIRVEMTSRRLQLMLGDVLLAEGDLHAPIVLDGSFWWVDEDSCVDQEDKTSVDPEEGKRVIRLTLEKRISGIWAGVWKVP